MTAWTLLIAGSTLPDALANDAWDHLNNLGGGFPSPIPSPSGSTTIIYLQGLLAFEMNVGDASLELDVSGITLELDLSSQQLVLDSDKELDADVAQHSLDLEV